MVANDLVAAARRGAAHQVWRDGRRGGVRRGLPAAAAAVGGRCRSRPISMPSRACYEAGKPQLVSTKLVADLETPVSAYLKLADGRANSFLLESVEGGSVRGRYSIIGFKPDVIWRCTKGQAEINRRARSDTHAFEPLEGRPLETLRAPDPRMPDGTAARPAADGVGPVRLPGLRHGPRHGAAARQEPRSDRPARRDHGAADPDLHLRPPRRQRHPGDAGLAAGRHRRARGLRGGAGTAGRRGVGLRALAALPPRERRCARRPARAAGQHDQGRIQGDGRDLQGVHPRGRRLPDRALAALLRCRSSCRRCRSTGRCAASTPRRS